MSEHTLADYLDAMGLEPELRSQLRDALGDAESTTLVQGAEPPRERSGAGPLDGLVRYDSAGLDERYEMLGFFGHGGMGDVRRVRDRALGRIVAMKVLHERLVGRPEIEARFVEEAQLSGQLEHPGVVPVFELARLPDGRPFFTMQRVSGEPLGKLLRRVHERGLERDSLRRLVELFRTLCEIVAYAHERSVVHRDIKPANVLIGRHGEVMLVDWGIAKVGDGIASVLPAVETVRSQDPELHTRLGTVQGTPAYMPPEQARGERVDARSDVYSLGATLYCLLGGRAPYQGSTTDVLEAVRTRPPAPLAGANAGVDTFTVSEGSAWLPDALVDVCDKSMRRDPQRRHAHAGEMLEDISSWLDGSRRRAQARRLVEQARAALPAALRLRTRAAAICQDAEERLAELPPWAPEGDKLPSWSALDEAAAVERKATGAETRVEHLLQSALSMSPELAEAHEALAELYRERHQRAEEARDHEATEESAGRLRLHASVIVEPTARERMFRYLRGRGALTLHTEPRGARVELRPFVPHNRRLVLGPGKELGNTPLEAVPVAMGSYLVVLRKAGHHELRYPLFIAREAHWDGVPPGQRRPLPILLPRAGELSQDDCFVPAGWCRVSGDRWVRHALPARRIWVDSFVMRRFPVTNREFLACLNDLEKQGRHDEALRIVPRPPGSHEQEAPPVYLRGDDGRWSLGPDRDGDVWGPDWPVLSVDWFGATAYAAWEAERTGLPWRLPGEWEWEKAARGADGRQLPWGDHSEPTWARNRDSQAGRPGPVDVDSNPVDVSVYGVRGLAGNVGDWCRDPFQVRPDFEGDRPPAPGTTPPRLSEAVFRGGTWNTLSDRTHCAARMDVNPRARFDIIGFRLARSWP